MKGFIKMVKVLSGPVLIQALSTFFLKYNSIEGYMIVIAIWALACAWIYTNIQHYIEGLDWEDTYMYLADKEE